MLNSKPDESCLIVGESQLTCLLTESEYIPVQISFVAASFTQGCLCLAVQGGFLSHCGLMSGSKGTCTSWRYIRSACSVRALCHIDTQTHAI